MVLPGTGVQHIRADDAVFNAIADQEIVDSPSAVVDLAGPDPLGPPGVGAGEVAVDMAEAVCQADGQQIRKSFSLLISKTGRHMIVFRMRQVDLLVGDVIVPAGDDWLFFIQPGQVFRVFPVPDLALLKPPQSVPRVWGIDQIEETVIQLQRDQPAFHIHGFRRSDGGIVRLNRQPLAIEGHGSGIAFSGRLSGTDPNDLMIREILIQGRGLFFVHS